MSQFPLLFTSMFRRMEFDRDIKLKGKFRLAGRVGTVVKIYGHGFRDVAGKHGIVWGEVEDYKFSRYSENPDETYDVDDVLDLSMFPDLEIYYEQ